MRRGGARREVTERVTLRSDDGKTHDGKTPKILEGWALNVSRGGVRAILEEKVTLGQTFEVSIGTDEVQTRPGRVVWVQEEPERRDRRRRVHRRAGGVGHPQVRSAASRRLRIESGRPASRSG